MSIGPNRLRTCKSFCICRDEVCVQNGLRPTSACELSEMKDSPLNFKMWDIIQLFSQAQVFTAPQYCEPVHLLPYRLADLERR